MTTKEKNDKEETKRLLAQRESVMCGCSKVKSQLRDRGKYGTCRCDGYSFCYTFGFVFSNALYQYLADAKQVIIREDWDIIEKHAKAIKEYATADIMDVASDDSTKRYELLNKERDFREAMHWLSENWHSLWW